MHYMRMHISIGKTTASDASSKHIPKTTSVLQALEGEEDDAELAAEAEAEDDGGDKVSVAALASSSAAFWQRMLRARWARLVAEDAEAAAEARARPGAAGEGDDGSGVLRFALRGQIHVWFGMWACYSAWSLPCETWWRRALAAES